MSDELRILILGGTSWLGGEVARQAVARGHRVTCLARGESGRVPAGARHVVADRWSGDAYDEVAAQDWDAVIDVSWQPDLVRSALHSLASRTRHWIYVSSISAYADHSMRGLDESAELLPALSGTGAASIEQYGEAKVSCETACREAIAPDQRMVARAGLIVGYGDRSDRFGYWPARFALAQPSDQVLVPPPDMPVQVIDAADLARWLVDSAEQRTAGVFDAVGEQLTFADVAASCLEVASVEVASVEVASVEVASVEVASAEVAGAEVAGAEAARGTPALVDPGEEWLLSSGVSPWAGPESLPLWLPRSTHAGMVSRPGLAARTAGLLPRPLRDTILDALRWERELGLERTRSAGLSRPRETELIAHVAARRAGRSF